jgi:diguanylate cyclase (GGDEF)-like protein/PAS domain S-box-containing protein
MRYRELQNRYGLLALCLAIGLLLAFRVLAQQTLSVPRHAEEGRALIEPEAVLQDLPGKIAAARARGDHREVALLRLAESNACRVLSRLTCQRDAGRLAHEAASLAADRHLQVRGLILESSGEIALQDFVSSQRALDAAERLLRLEPHPLLAADVYLGYSSIAHQLGKFEQAQQYAARGLEALGDSEAPVIRVRLLRNRARAWTQLDQVEPAIEALHAALDLIPEPQDPKLRAELHLELARIAGSRQQPEDQSKHARVALALATQLHNPQLRGSAHEMLGNVEARLGRLEVSEEEFRQAIAAFRELQYRRDERRVLRELVQLLAERGRSPADMPALLERLVNLEIALDAEDQALAAHSFESRLKYARQEFQVGLLQQSVALAAQRQRLFYVLIIAAVALLAGLAGAMWLQRRYGARLAAALQRARESEARLQASEQRMRALTDHLPASIAEIDADERYVEVNAHLAQMVGKPPSEIIGRTVLEVRGDTIHQHVKPAMDAALDGELVHFRSSGDVFGKLRHYDTIFVPGRANDGTVRGFYSIAFDVTELTEAQTALEQLARIDPLTGVANRRHFEERLEATLAHARRTGRGIVVLAMDLDKFKGINDTYGHPVGDEVLREFVRRVRAHVRQDDFFARLGGDEFVLLVEEPPAIAGEVIAKKLLRAMEAPFVVDHLTLGVSSSIGAAYGTGADSAADLMSLADQALYDAKARGRATFSIRRTPPPAQAVGQRQAPAG